MGGSVNLAEHLMSLHVLVGSYSGFLLQFLTWNFVFIFYFSNYNIHTKIWFNFQYLLNFERKFQWKIGIFSLIFLLATRQEKEFKKKKRYEWK